MKSLSTLLSISASGRPGRRRRSANDNNGSSLDRSLHSFAPTGTGTGTGTGTRSRACSKYDHGNSLQDTDYGTQRTQSTLSDQPSLPIPCEIACQVDTGIGIHEGTTFRAPPPPPSYEECIQLGLFEERRTIATIRGGKSPPDTSTCTSRCTIPSASGTSTSSLLEGQTEAPKTTSSRAAQSERTTAPDLLSYGFQDDDDDDDDGNVFICLRAPPLSPSKRRTRLAHQDSLPSTERSTVLVLGESGVTSTIPYLNLRVPPGASLYPQLGGAH